LKKRSVFLIGYMKQTSTKCGLALGLVALALCLSCSRSVPVQERESLADTEAALKAAVPPPEQETDPFRKETIARMNLGKQVALAFIMYADDQAEKAFPQSLDQVKVYLTTTGDHDAEGGATRASAQAHFEVVSRGTLTNFSSPMQTILLREKEARRGIDGKWVRVYVFADGHVEAQGSPDGDFDKLEKERGMITVTK